MPTKKISSETGNSRFDWPLTGRLRRDVDPMLIGETNFQTLTNMRYTVDGIKGIQGMTKINATALAYDFVVNGFHFKKDSPVAETHVFVQANSGSHSALYKSDNGAAIPAQDTFTSFVTLEDTTTVAFSNAPDGAMCVLNGETNRIWGGDEMRVGSFITCTAAPALGILTNPRDYTDAINNSLTDADNVAYIGGGIDSYVGLLIHADEADGTAGTSILDSSLSPKTITAAGNAQVDTAQAEFGTGSVLFDGTGDYLSLADSADWYMGTGEATIDFWVRFDTSPSGTDHGLFRQYVNSSNYVSLHTISGTMLFVICASGSSTVVLSWDYGSVAGLTTGRFYHIALIRGWGGVGNSWALCVDGYPRNVATNAIAWPDLAAEFDIGRGMASIYLNGWIDEFRISKGVARWTANFSPPSSAYHVRGKFWLIGSTKKLQGLKYYVANANTETSVQTGYEWSGVGWSALTLTDNTVTAGASLAKTGTVTFPSTVNTSKVTAINNSIAYWYYFELSAGAAEIYQVTLDAEMQDITDLWDGVPRYCLQFYKYTTAYTDYTTNVLPSTTNNPKVYDAADVGTYAQLGLLTDAQYLYGGFAERLMGLQITMPDSAKVNAVTANILVDLWDGEAWSTVGVVVDNTATAGVTLSHSGTISFNPTSLAAEFQTAVADQNQWYYYRIHFSDTLSADVRVSAITGMTAPKDIQPYRFSVLWQNRLFLCNDIHDKQNTVLCSAYGTNCVFNGDDSLKMEFGDSMGLVAAETLYTRYGQGIYDDLVVLKKDATFMVDGTWPTNWITYNVSNTVGCVAPLTLKRCDMSYDVAPGISKHILMWRSSRGIEYFDGNTLSLVSDDIKNFFDPASDDYIDPQVVDVSAEAGSFDEINFEYHWYFTLASGQDLVKQEWVFALKYKKWFDVSRGTGKALNMAFTARDTYGNSFEYGATSDGFIERLENGTDFDENPMVYTFQTGDILLAKTGDYVCTLRHLKLFARAKNISSAKVACTHYADTDATGTVLPAISQANATKRIYQAKQSVNIDAVLHGLKYTVTTSTEAIGFEPMLVSGLYRVKREDI